MRVMCIDNGGYFLKTGKVYSVEICKDSPSEFESSKQVFDYYIFNDKGIRHGVEKELFIDIVKIRQDKLKELGI